MAENRSTGKPIAFTDRSAFATSGAQTVRENRVRVCSPR
jgi:hypothetical protein